MSLITAWGSISVTIMLIAYALDSRSAWWTLVLAFGCAASSAYGWMSGTWPFGVVEAIWAGVALVRFFKRRDSAVLDPQPRPLRSRSSSP